ncbi:peptidase S15 [Marinicauda salina]|uniref:Peptidase S15 n=1 Tax=Marinicauda salina TaxID=2135793 RepID=A0A2U2BY54_9PROT|nr:peptidase S15 [Marinicauda salina]
MRRLENVWIPMPDGTRLAARIWLPEDAEDQPIPAVLEYIPYRKRDFTRLRDSIMHPYIAGHGYACVRVDLRGAGDSDGLLRDEYTEQELQDGVAVLSWIAAQDWCSGQVGMIGISWGGFNGLQIAARRPPELKAVITASSTDDRYADDIHHMGGCLLGDNLSWASVMFAYNAMPPDPEIVGERWREMWMERLEANDPWLIDWLDHQRRDDYWRHGSICEDFSRVQCPVFAVSGWADGYSNAVFRLLANLPGPCKGLIGPWSHKYPHLGVPGPAIGFLQECLRWWDAWLKGVDTGIMDEPALRVWMQDSVRPTARYAHRPGRFVEEPAWPSPNIRERRFGLDQARLVEGGEPPLAHPLTIQSPLTVGLFAGKWCSYAAGPDLAHDQREEDGGALVFDTDPLEAELEILGAPRVELELSSNQPIAMLAARLSDVAPDDKATRISYGLLNLTHRDSSAHPAHLEPGRVYRVSLDLNGIAQAFPEGHRLRLSLSTSYWPLAWAPPKPTRLMIHAGAFILPERPPRAEDETVRPFGPPLGAPAEQRRTLDPQHHNWLVHRDLAADESTLEVINDYGRFHIDEIDLTITNRVRELYVSRADDFNSLRGEVTSTRELVRGGWRVRTDTRTVLTSTETEFRVRADLDAYEGGTRVFCRSWDRRIPRDFV